MSRDILLRCSWRAALLGFALFAGCASSGTEAVVGSVDSGEQLRFGIQMARRGLWSEALFRFEQARRLAPEDARILNDLAVAYEATGRYEDARATYEEALRVAPGEGEIKRNYSRFLEFYQGFKPEKAAAAEAPGAAAGGGGR